MTLAREARAGLERNKLALFTIKSQCLPLSKVAFQSLEASAIRTTSSFYIKDTIAVF